MLRFILPSLCRRENETKYVGGNGDPSSKAPSPRVSSEDIQDLLVCLEDSLRVPRQLFKQLFPNSVHPRPAARLAARDLVVSLNDNDYVVKVQNKFNQAGAIVFENLLNHRDAGVFQKCAINTLNRFSAAAHGNSTSAEDASELQKYKQQLQRRQFPLRQPEVCTASPSCLKPGPAITATFMQRTVQTTKPIGHLSLLHIFDFQ